MKIIHSLHIYILVVITSFLGACRPPSLNDEWQRNPHIERDTELPGQRPQLDLVNIQDNRPEYIKRADNPNYDPNSNLIRDTLKWIFGGSGGGQPGSVRIDPPPAGPDNIDIYDIKSGKVNTSEGMIDPNSPEIAALRESANNTGNEFGSKRFLLEQRDYARDRSVQLVNELNQKQIDPFSMEIEQKLAALKSEVDTAVAGHNTSVNNVLAQAPENENLPAAEGYEFKTAPYSANGQRVRATQQSVNYAKSVVSQMTGQAKVRGDAAIGIAQNAVIAADQAYAAGDQETGNFAIELATTAVDVGLGLIPGVGLAKDAIEAATGYNIVTGAKLTQFERSMAVLGVLTGGYGSKLAVLGKSAVIVGILRGGAKGPEAVEDVVRAADGAQRVIDSARNLKRYGPLEKGPAHMIPAGEGSVADTFRSGSYFSYESSKLITVYRVQGKPFVEGDRLGRYWTRDMPTGPVQSIVDSALDPTWGNKGTHWLKMEIPAGEVLHEGVAAAQRGLVGGGNQIFIEKIDPVWLKGQGVFR